MEGPVFGVHSFKVEATGKPSFVVLHIFFGTQVRPVTFTLMTVHAIPVEHGLDLAGKIEASGRAIPRV